MRPVDIPDAETTLKEMRFFNTAGPMQPENTGSRLMAVVDKWYRGYRFAQDARNDLYYTNLVLNYLAESIPNAGPPGDLIDRNMRIDCGELFHLLTVNRQLNDNFDLLRQLACKGTVDSAVRSGFPLEELAEPENLPSLLHYFGLLSIRKVRDGMPRLAIPNQTVRQLMYGYLRDGYCDVGVFAVDRYTFGRRCTRWRTATLGGQCWEFLSAAIAGQSSIRDYIDGEKVIQGFPAAYLSATDHFVFHTERELGGGYADICAGAAPAGLRRMVKAT